MNQNERWRRVDWRIRALYAMHGSCCVTSLLMGVVHSPWWFCIGVPLLIHGLWSESRNDGYLVDMTPHWRDEDKGN